MALSLAEIDVVVCLGVGSPGITKASARQVRVNFKNGAIYTGEALMQGSRRLLKISGIGEYQRCDGEQFAGRFFDGLLQGEGTQTSRNGDIVRCTFVNGIKEGKGELRKGDGTILHCIWKNGKISGPGIRLHPGGCVEKSYWKGGKRDPWTSSLTIPKKAKPTIVLIEPGYCANSLVSRTLRGHWGIDRLDVFETAYHRLGPKHSQSPAQKRIRKMILNGTLPRTLVARLQRKLLQEQEGKGLLVDFPFDVEEAKMIETWGFHVTACIVLHVDANTLASQSWLAANPMASLRDVPSSLNLEKYEEELAAYEEETAPLIEYYKHVYIPVLVTPRNAYQVELHQRLGL